MLGSVAHAHDNPLNPTHAHGLQIKDVRCGAHVETALVFWKESPQPCPTTGCNHTCLYHIWGTFRGQRIGTPYRNCHIEDSHSASDAIAIFHPAEPSWNDGAWGIVVRDGWGQMETQCSH